MSWIILSLISIYNPSFNREGGRMCAYSCAYHRIPINMRIARKHRPKTQQAIHFRLVVFCRQCGCCHPCLSAASVTSRNLHEVGKMSQFAIATEMLTSTFVYYSARLNAERPPNSQIRISRINSDVIAATQNDLRPSPRLHSGPSNGSPSAKTSDS